MSSHLKDTELLISQNHRNQTNHSQDYSTVTEASSKLLQTSNQSKSYSLKMSVDFVSSNLWTSPYSDYQSFLFDTIENFTKKGWTYLRIANWFNKENHLTPRGKKFQASHVWSIHIKKKKSIERFGREFKPEITDLGIDVVDI